MKAGTTADSFQTATCAGIQCTSIHDVRVVVTGSSVRVRGGGRCG